MAVPKFDSCEAFWPYYLKEHRLASTRWVHWVGTNGVLLVIAVCLLSMRPWWILLFGPLCGYGFAWFSRNRVSSLPARKVSSRRMRA